MLPRGLSRTEAARYIGIGSSLFDALVAEGSMPRPHVIRGRRVWDRIEVDQHFEELPYADEIVSAEAVKPVAASSEASANPFDSVFRSRENQ